MFSDYPSQTKRLILTFGFGLLSIAALLIGFGIFLLFDTSIFVSESKPVIAVVSGFDTRSGRGNHLSYYPKFIFKLESGETVTSVSDTTSSPTEFSEGQSIAIRYALRNPHHTKIDNLIDLYGDGVMVIALGFFFGLIASIVFRKSKSHDAPKLSRKKLEH